MANLPLLPGYNFHDVSIQDYKLPHKLDILNGFPVVHDINFGIGRRPTDTASITYAGVPDPIEYDPSLIYGRAPRYAYQQFLPHHVLFAQKCLRFKAFFRQRIFDSPHEHYRIRYVNIMYFLEDDTLHVIEPVVKNAGFRQGKLVRRERIPKNFKGDLFTWKDFNVGIDVCIRGIVYHIVDCDPFTRKFLMSQGIDVGEKESPPVDLYTEQREAKYNMPSMRDTRMIDDTRRRFLEYDGMILSFDATWNNDRYQIMYFLMDNTMAIREIREPNDGKDPMAMLLKRRRVPKNWQHLPSWFPSIYLEYGDPEVEYYTSRDFRLGETILVFGRCFLLHDCDTFTRIYYSDMLGTPQPSAIPFPIRMDKLAAPKYEIPPHINFGSPEDTYASCLSLMPKPPKKNMIRQLVNFPKRLRYSIQMAAVHPEDENRNFVLEYSLSDGTLQISEIKKRNSGRCEGRFLSWRLIPKPGTGKDDPAYYTPEDFFIGGCINIFDHRFIITGADFFVYRYVEANHDKFCKDLRENLRNYFLQQNILQNDTAIEARKIQEVESERKLFVDNVVAKHQQE